jgi:hypothetical protein
MKIYIGDTDLAKILTLFVCNYVTIHDLSNWDVSWLHNAASKGQNQTRKEEPMNEHAQKLQAILEKDTLTVKLVGEGVVACFYAINRDFVKRRMGEVPAE